MDVMLFDIQTPIGIKVHCTRAYWAFIVSEKHPVLAGQEKMVEAALADPDQIRRSKRDPANLPFLQRHKTKMALCRCEA